MMAARKVTDHEVEQALDKLVARGPVKCPDGRVLQLNKRRNEAGENVYWVSEISSQ